VLFQPLQDLRDSIIRYLNVLEPRPLGIQQIEMSCDWQGTLGAGLVATKGKKSQAGNKR
jgi:hypothetical protein